MDTFKCRICGNDNATACSSILEAELPLAANVTAQPSRDMKRFPMHIVRCGRCGHVQLKETLDATFYGTYLYTPSYASGFVEYIEVFARHLSMAIDKPNRTAMEIGSANGFLLKQLQQYGWDVLGIEPSVSLAKRANLDNIPTYNGFFSEDTVGEIKKRMDQPDVLIVRHVMEHLDHLDAIVGAIKSILGSGLLLVEVPYLKRIVLEKQFYAFFHEHLSYYSVTALANLLARHKMYIHKVFENELEGGAILVAANSSNIISEADNVEQYLDDEVNSLSSAKIQAFADGISSNIDRIRHLIAKAHANGKKVAAWGAGQRGCTLISLCGFQSDDLAYVVDVNKYYWNRFVPGTDIRIVPSDYCHQHPVDIILIFATGYANSIIAENSKLLDAGVEFVNIL